MITAGKMSIASVADTFVLPGLVSQPARVQHAWEVGVFTQKLVSV